MIDAKRLWVAVLEQAIVDLTNADGCAPHERPRIRYFAELWFRSDNYEPGSFTWICDHLDIDALWFRHKLFKLVDASPVSSRPMFWHPAIRKKSGTMIRDQDQNVAGPRSDLMIRNVPLEPARPPGFLTS